MSAAVKSPAELIPLAFIYYGNALLYYITPVFLLLFSCATVCFSLQACVYEHVRLAFCVRARWKIAAE